MSNSSLLNPSKNYAPDYSAGVSGVIGTETTITENGYLCYWTQSVPTANETFININGTDIAKSGSQGAYGTAFNVNNMIFQVSKDDVYLVKNYGSPVVIFYPQKEV